MGCCWKGQHHTIIKNREKGRTRGGTAEEKDAYVVAGSGGVPTEAGGVQAL